MREIVRDMIKKGPTVFFCHEPMPLNQIPSQKIDLLCILSYFKYKGGGIRIFVLIMQVK